MSNELGFDVDRLCDWIDEIGAFIDKAESVEEISSAIHSLQREYRRRTFQPDGYVYVLRAGLYVKIGRAKHPDKRIKQLQIQLPFAVEVESVIPCERYVEAEQWLHSIYLSERVNGEWFFLPDSIGLKCMESISHDPESGIPDIHGRPVSQWEPYIL